ncbi:MAG: DUF1858 domain-containing protein [Methanosarcinales archaeon]
MPNNNKITGDMKIEEIVAMYPRSLSIFVRYDVGVDGCRCAPFSSLKEGAMIKGIDLDAILKDLNELATRIDAKNLKSNEYEYTR